MNTCQGICGSSWLEVINTINEEMSRRIKSAHLQTYEERRALIFQDITRIQLSLLVDGPRVRLETADDANDRRRRQQTFAYLGLSGPSN